MMSDFTNRCFVCEKGIDPQTAKINVQVNLPVCDDCSGSEREKCVVDELFDGLAEGFVCGCI